MGMPGFDEAPPVSVDVAFVTSEPYAVHSPGRRGTITHMEGQCHLHRKVIGYIISELGGSDERFHFRPRNSLADSFDIQPDSDYGVVADAVMAAMMGAA